MDERLEEAFCELYRESFFLVLKRASFFFGDDALAHDLTHDVFLKVVVELDKGNTQVLNRRYLTRLATNLFIDHVRRHRDKAPIAMADETLTLLHHYDGAAAAERTVYVRELFDRLPKRLQAIALYRHVDGYTLDELVELTGLSKRTVQRRLDKIQRLLERI